MKITISPDPNGTTIEIPQALAAVLERAASPLIVTHEMGPLVSLGVDRQATIRPGWVAQVNAKTDATTAICTVKGFVFTVDEPYRAVQEKLGGVAKA